MKGVFFRPCPKCGRICNSELDMCEICSGKIAKPEPPKPIIPVVTPVVEPIVEEQVATEEVIEEVATEENIVEETINEEKQEEVVVPVIETKAPKGKGAKGLYALVAVLMLVIVALVVVIMQDRQPTVAVGNTTLPSNTTSTTSAQETETTTEITEGTTVDNAGETLAPVTTTKKAQNTNKETTTKKNTSSSTKETTTKKITTTTTTEANEVEFNPEIVYSKDEVYRVFLTTWNDGAYFADVKVDNVRVEMNERCSIHITIKIIKLYDILNNYGDLQEISEIEFSTIKDTEVRTSNFVLYAYNENGELYSKERVFLACTNGEKIRPGNSFTDSIGITDDEIDNVTKYDLMCEEG